VDKATETMASQRHFRVWLALGAILGAVVGAVVGGVFESPGPPLGAAIGMALGLAIVWKRAKVAAPRERRWRKG